jgi:hypothetical protein
MFRYQTCIYVRLLYDTDTYNYIELYHFFKSLAVQHVNIVSSIRVCVRARMLKQNYFSQ